MDPDEDYGFLRITITFGKIEETPNVAARTIAYNVDLITPEKPTAWILNQ